MSAPEIGWAVMSHPERDRPGEALSWLLGAMRFVDDGSGETATGDRAWEGLAGSLTDWSVVVQDDAQPIAAIHAQAPLALASAPTPVVSFYLGTSYPEHTVAPARVAMLKADEAGSAWITAPRLFWGVAVAVRTELVPGMLRDIAKNRRPYDERISRWAERSGHRVSYTWPSLVDHADGESLIRSRPRVKPRVAYRVGAAPRWDTPPVPM